MPARDHDSHGESPGPHVDELIAALAASQHGVVSRRQLDDVATRGEIEHRLRRMRLISLHRGVYAVGHRELTREGRYLAAVLACGNGARLSHRHAAALHGLRPTDRPRIDVTVPRSGPCDRPGIKLHETAAFDPADLATVAGIPVTAWPRTIADLGTVLPPRAVERALDEAVARRIYDQAALDDLIARTPGHRGAAVLARILTRHTAGTTWTRSELEEAGLALARDAGLRDPEVNAWIAGYEVDLLWRDARLAVELDGHAFHATPAARRRDREKDRALRAAGIWLERFDWHDITRDRATTAQVLRDRCPA